jgi:palmitoyl-protein thioesterase
MWHGMGGTCCEPLVITPLMETIKEAIPGVYIKSLMFGITQVDDLLRSYNDQVNKQVAEACQMIASDPQLKNGYHAVGISQGCQFLRAVAQRCPNPPMRVLVTLAGQHQGVYGVPETCPGISGQMQMCLPAARQLATNYILAYSDLMQKTLVQAQYWHDPLHEDVYREKSVFIADINNERVKNQTYINNLLKLEKLVLIMNAQDGFVIPRESSHFGFYKPGSDSEVIPMRQTRLYLEDRIGLKKLDESGRVKEYVIPGEHIFMNHTWFKTEIAEKYLKT